MSHILLMNNAYPTEKNPKHGSYVKSIKESLESAGHSVNLCVLNSDFKNRRQHLINYIIFYKRILKEKFYLYDYVLVNNFGYVILPLLKSIRDIKNLVIHWHGSDLYAPNKIFQSCFDIAVRKLPGNTKHITPSEYFKKQVSNKHKIPLQQIEISPSGGIDTCLFHQKKTSDRRNNAEVLELGFASGLSVEKGADIILFLLNNIQSIEDSINKKMRLHYIYYGSQKHEYGSLFKNYTNTVCWEVMPSHQMPKFFQSIDILLFPTKREAESLGLVALEAMSCGCPVLGTDAFAIKEYIVSGVTGERFIMNDLHDFINKLKCMISNIKTYDPRKFVLEKYSREKVVKFYENYFK